MRFLKYNTFGAYPGESIREIKVCRFQRKANQSLMKRRLNRRRSDITRQGVKTLPLIFWRNMNPK